MSLTRAIKRLSTALAAAATLVSAGPATAQEIGQDAISYLGTFAFATSLQTWDQAKQLGAEPVLDHTRYGFKPIGITMPMGHMLFPYVKAATQYDDNILLTPDKTADLRTNLGAGFDWQANLPRHMLKVTGNTEAVRFKNHGNLDYTDGNIRADFRIDIDAADTIGGTLVSTYGHDDTFLPIEPKNAAAAVPIWSNRVGIGYMHDAGRTALVTGFDITDSQIFDVPTYGGGIADKSAGSSTDYGIFGFLSYKFSPGYRTFASVRLDRQVMKRPDVAYANNNSYRAESGLVYELDPLLKFTLYGGYQLVHFDDASQYDLSTFTFQGSMEWQPTQRMTISLDGGRRLQKAEIENTFGSIIDDAHGKLEYDIWHNIIATLNGSLQRKEFIGGNRTDWQWSAGASVDYLLNENLALTLGYQHIDRVSTDSTYDFDDNRFMATLKLSQ
jgi:hypothetical protein